MQNIIKNIQKIAVLISEELKYADFGYTDGCNTSGDTQLKLDVKSDMIIEKELSKINSIKSLVSEEKENELIINSNAKYVVAYDPLDGSSLVDVNFAVGSIFGIYKDEISPKNLVASVYTIYGPRVEMVVCMDKVELYRLDKDDKFKFIKELKLKEKGKLNATGATQKGWSKKHKKLIEKLFAQGYRLRYSGAMVADLHQILLKGGGLFSYPATTDAPNGKLRVAFEVLPFAFIYECAGGATSDGNLDSLFKIKVDKIHQTTPCFFGSKYEIKSLLEIYGEDDE